MKKLLVLAAILAIAAPSAFGLIGSKDGSQATLVPGAPNAPSETRADWEYNTTGMMDGAATSGGSATGWGEFFICTVQNTAGAEIFPIELGWPLCGAETEAYGWLVWVGDMGGPVCPMGDAYTADFFGPFTPVDPAPGTFPPTVYTYVDVSGFSIDAGAWFTFGYDNTGTGGHIDYNGVECWAWYGGAWDPEVNYARTQVHQIKANFEGGGTATETTTWGGIKALF